MRLRWLDPPGGLRLRCLGCLMPCGAHRSPCLSAGGACADRRNPTPVYGSATSLPTEKIVSFPAGSLLSFFQVLSLLRCLESISTVTLRSMCILFQAISFLRCFKSISTVTVCVSIFFTDILPLFFMSSSAAVSTSYTHLASWLSHRPIRCRRLRNQISRRLRLRLRAVRLLRCRRLRHLLSKHLRLRLRAACPISYRRLRHLLSKHLRLRVRAMCLTAPWKTGSISPTCHPLPLPKGQPFRGPPCLQPLLSRPCPSLLLRSCLTTSRATLPTTRSL